MQHDDVIKWKYFPHYSTFVRWIHRSQVNSPHKGQWRGTLMFSLICALIKPFSKQSWGWWFATPSRSLWRHCNNHVLEMKPPDAYTIRLLTLWGPDKIVVISKTTFSNTFSWMKIYEFRLRFHWSLFLRVQLIIFQYWFRKKAWCRPGDKPLSEPMMGRLPTHICATRPQWVKFTKKIKPHQFS